jgi:pyruvate/2-oxoglutarate dehydrogenase complex dihydrolipoamide acyltransferase (E2) component
MAVIEIKVPDIGDFDEVAVIELLVKVGDTIRAEQSLVTVESDKASMEIPSSHAGVVKELKVAAGRQGERGQRAADAGSRRCGFQRLQRQIGSRPRKRRSSYPKM